MPLTSQHCKAADGWAPTASAMKHSGIQAASQHITEREIKQGRDLQPVSSNFSAASTSHGGSLWRVEPSLLLFPHEKKKWLFSLDSTSHSNFRGGVNASVPCPAISHPETGHSSSQFKECSFSSPCSDSTSGRADLCPSQDLGTLRGTSR